MRQPGVICGDAAGLLEPLTREGISYALRSGWLAGKWAVRIAEAADAAQARRQALNYTFAIKSELGAEMGAGRRLLAVFSRHPRMMHLDFAVSDLATLVRSAIEAGATEAEFQPQDDVRVMLDPHGHPFCLWFYPESSG